MSEQNTKILSQLKDDFDRLRAQPGIIRCEYLHRATNAEAEGVCGSPNRLTRMVAMVGAGNRYFQQIFDQDGAPLYREDPILDVKGQPIQDPDGRFRDVVMPAFRSVMFDGEVADYQALNRVVERAGRYILSLPPIPSTSFASEWDFSTPADLWWALVFEMAWSGRHPMLVAERQLWLSANNHCSFFPYDIEQIRSIASMMKEQSGIPEQWLRRLPDAWTSELGDAAAACFDVCDVLLDELQNTDSDANTSIPTSGSPTTSERCTSAKTSGRRRFSIALSFPGEYRETVEKIADELVRLFGDKARILYDKYHEVELACPNLDLVFQRFFAEDTDLVVAFLCAEYQEKEWCGVEWRAIRELIKTKRNDKDVMLLRLDDADIDGLLSIDGYLDISSMEPKEVAKKLLQRWLQRH